MGLKKTIGTVLLVSRAKSHARLRAWRAREAGCALALAVALSLACGCAGATAGSPAVLGGAGEGGGSASAAAPSAGAVAATVNGEELPLSTLTGYLDGVRATLGSTTDAALEAYLADLGYTPQEYWDYLVSHYGREMVVVQRCDELGIEPTDLEIDARISELRDMVGAGEDAADAEAAESLWAAYLEGAGLTEDTLRDVVRYNLRATKLYEREVPRTDDMSESEWQAACQEYVQGLYDAADVEVLVNEMPGFESGE